MMPPGARVILRMRRGWPRTVSISAERSRDLSGLWLRPLFSVGTRLWPTARPQTKARVEERKATRSAVFMSFLAVGSRWAEVWSNGTLAGAALARVRHGKGDRR